MSRKPRRNSSEYFAKMLDEEREYRAATSGDKADEPFVTPLLFSILDSLRAVAVILSFFLGGLLTLLFLRL